MSIIKRALYPGNRENELRVQVVRPGTGVKLASCLMPGVQSLFDRLEPSNKFTYVLVNAMGYSEYFGANSNHDWYGHNEHLNHNGLLHAWDDIGTDIELDRVKGKSWPFGYPCFYNAAVYAHHNNEDPSKFGFGDVIYSGLNPHMKRVELVLRVFNDEAEKKGHTNILSRIVACDRCDVSMGAKVPFDLCSICTNWDEVRKALTTFDPAKHAHEGIAVLAYHRLVKPIRGLAVTRKDYCQHMLHTPGVVFPDGRKVFVYNDWPRFFDISFVWIGADKTARVFMFVAGSSFPKPKPQLSLEGLLNRLSGTKVASIEKEIPDGLVQAVRRDALASTDHYDLFKKLAPAEPSGIRSLLTSLAALGIVPTPHEFQSLLISTFPDGEGLNSALDSKGLIFDETLNGIDDTYAVGPEHHDAGLTELLSPLLEERSSYQPFICPRLINASKTAAKPMTSLRSPILNDIAAKYNGMRISMLEKASSLAPEVVPYLDPELLLSSRTKESSLDALLLGLPPVIHLLASRADNKMEEGKHVGRIAKFVADNPTFSTMATIGAALRLAIATKAAGGLGPAAGIVVDTLSKVL